MFGSGFLGGFGDITKTAQVLVEHAPKPFPNIDMGVVPDVGVADELANYFGASNPLVVAVAQALNSDMLDIGRLVAEAMTLMGMADADFIQLGGKYLQEVSALAPQVLSMNPALQAKAFAQLSALSQQTQHQAQQRSQQLGVDLSPVAEKLQEISAIPPTAAAAFVPPESLAPPAPETTPTPEAAPAPPTPNTPTEAGLKAVQAAESQIGTPYQWGGNTPGVGLDCSGLTKWAWAQAGVDIPRLAEHQNVGREVSPDELIPGDLLVWDGHVAMYKGDGQIIEAGDPVQVGPLRTTNMGMAFKGYFRPTG